MIPCNWQSWQCLAYQSDLHTCARVIIVDNVAARVYLGWLSAVISSASGQVSFYKVERHQSRTTPKECSSPPSPPLTFSPFPSIITDFSCPTLNPRQRSRWEDRCRASQSALGKLWRETRPVTLKFQSGFKNELQFWKKLDVINHNRSTPPPFDDVIGFV